METVFWDVPVSTAQVKQSFVAPSLWSQICGCRGWHHWRLWRVNPAPHALQWPAANVVRLICLTFRYFDGSPANTGTSGVSFIGFKGSVQPTFICSDLSVWSTEEKYLDFSHKGKQLISCLSWSFLTLWYRLLKLHCGPLFALNAIRPPLVEQSGNFTYALLGKW